MIKGHIPHEVAATANLHHGEVSALPFGNKSAPFSIMLVPKQVPDVSTFGPLLLSCCLIGDPQPSPLPIDDLREAMGNGKIWSPRNIIFIDDSQNSQNVLQRFRVFWVAGFYSPIE